MGRVKFATPLFVCMYLLVNLLTTSIAFVTHNSGWGSASRRTSTSHDEALVVVPHSNPMTCLWMARKRGNLGSLLSEDDENSGITTTTRSSTIRKSKKTTSSKQGDTKSTTKKTTSSRNKDQEDTAISPALAAWMASQKDGQSSKSSTTASSNTQAPAKTAAIVDDGATFESFVDEEDVDNVAGDGKKKNTVTQRRVKQSQRKAVEEALNAKVESTVEQLLSVIQGEESNKTKDLQTIVLENLQNLITLQKDANVNLRLLTAGNSYRKGSDYRLAWVGSDEAVCHIGTGLHKVPLARLQEVFLSLPGRNAVTIQEVIRILGPFPNIKNTLQGTSAVAAAATKRNGAVTDWKITWESMVDGTGKELLAGKEENVRVVNLQVYFSHPSIIVAMVPPVLDDLSQVHDSFTSDNAKHILVFVREEEMAEKLETLRVV